jgi:ABC transport system ATP-binding/permease protein
MWTLRTAQPDADAGDFAFRLTPGAVKTLGRATRSDFMVDAPLVSRFHCRFTVSDTGVLEVEDLESTNGTFVNDTRIERSKLSAGDRIKVGRVELAVDRS